LWAEPESHKDIWTGQLSLLNDSSKTYSNLRPGHAYIDLETSRDSCLAEILNTWVESITK